MNMDQETFLASLGRFGSLPVKIRRHIFDLVVQEKFAIKINSKTNTLTHTRCPSLELSRALRREVLRSWFEHGIFVFDDPSALERFLGSDAEPFEHVFEGQLDRPRRLKHLSIILLRPLEHINLTEHETIFFDGPNHDLFSLRWRRACRLLPNTVRTILFDFSNKKSRIPDNHCFVPLVRVLCAVLYWRTEGRVEYRVTGCRKRRENWFIEDLLPRAQESKKQRTQQRMQEAKKEEAEKLDKQSPKTIER